MARAKQGCGKLNPPQGRFRFKGNLKLICYLGIPLTLIVLEVQTIQSSIDINEPASDDDDMLTLSLGSNQPVRSSVLDEILQDQYADDFKVSQQVLIFTESALKQFASSQGLSPTGMPGAGMISEWLKGKQAPNQHLDEQTARIVSELDFVFANFWTHFKPLMMSIVENKPGNLDVTQLAFRCDRTVELTHLLQLSSQSVLFKTILDSFSSELYTHCIKRKLALIKIFNLKPSSIVRQFVDIYLSRPSSEPPNLHGLQGRAITDRGLKFDLQESLARHGPIEQVAALVIGSLSSPSLDHYKKLAETFVRDCRDHAMRLGQIWAPLDSIATFMSSSMINLIEFNMQVKLTATQLMYASICSQLVGR